MKITTIEARDIPDAWFQCVSRVLEDGFSYRVQQGSFEGDTRLEFDSITVYIKYPYREPYNMMLPDIPAALGIPNPVANDYIEQYLPYLMTDNKEPGEDYTYGSRIWMQIPYFIDLLKKTPNTNQAILQVARPEDRYLQDPPCLRHIDMRVRKVSVLGSDNFKQALIFYPYFRSWDLWGGFPANLAAIAVLQKYMADEIEIEAGPIIAYSKGLHIYGYAEELAKLRCHLE